MNIARGIKYSLGTYVALDIISNFSQIFNLNRQNAQINDLEQRIASLKQTQIPLKFQVLQRQNQKVLISLKFLDKNGHVIYYAGYPYVRFWLDGNEPEFDLAIVKLGSKYLGFPYRLCTDYIAPAKGKLLYQYYTGTGGVPLIFSPFDNADEKQAYIQLFSILKTNPGSLNVFGSLVTSASEVGQNFAINTTYSIIVHTAKGGVEIKRS